MEEEVCTICQEDLCNGQELHLYPCGHCHHTSCLLSAAHKGVFACPVCRKLPIENTSDVQCALEDAYDRENDQRLNKAFVRGLAMVRTQSRKASPELKRYVKLYYKHRTQIRKKNVDYVNLKAHIRNVNKKVDSYVQELKKCYKDAPKLPNHIKFHASPPGAPDTSGDVRIMNLYKRRIAREAGFEPVSAP